VRACLGSIVTAVCEQLPGTSASAGGSTEAAPYATASILSVATAVCEQMPGTAASAGGSTPRRQQISHVDDPPYITVSTLKRTPIVTSMYRNGTRALTFFPPFLQEAVRACLGSIVTAVCEQLPGTSASAGGSTEAAPYATASILKSTVHSDLRIAFVLGH
jgi:hypothetical protein